MAEKSVREGENGIRNMEAVPLRAPSPSPSPSSINSRSFQGV